MKSQFIIVGAEIELIPLREEFLLETLLWRNRSEIRRWFKSADELSFDQHQNWFHDYYLKKQDDFVFLVRDRVTGAHVGQVSIYRVDHAEKKAEVGRFIGAPAYQGKGYIRKACIELISFAFNVMGLTQLQLEVLCENERAIALYKSLGFSEVNDCEGLKRMLLTRQDGVKP